MIEQIDKVSENTSCFWICFNRLDHWFYPWNVGRFIIIFDCCLIWLLRWRFLFLILKRFYRNFWWSIWFYLFFLKLFGFKINCCSLSNALIKLNNFVLVIWCFWFFDSNWKLLLFFFNLLVLFLLETNFLIRGMMRTVFNFFLFYSWKSIFLERVLVLLHLWWLWINIKHRINVQILFLFFNFIFRTFTTFMCKLLVIRRRVLRLNFDLFVLL